jgi:hypothetical protein
MNNLIIIQLREKKKNDNHEKLIKPHEMLGIHSEVDFGMGKENQPIYSSSQ